MRKTETIRQLDEAREHCKNQTRRGRAFTNRRANNDRKGKWKEEMKKRETRWRRRQEYYAARSVCIADALDRIIQRKLKENS